MPIFARNSVTATYGVSANESYSYDDMGRILVESAQNDMILFNAVMANDFREQAALQEGTMVGSELQAFREFSVREAWEGLKKKLKKLWEKIKGVFRQVYAKLGVWFVRNGKAFAAMNRKILANKSDLGDCKLPVVLIKQGSFAKDPATAVNGLTKKAETMLKTIESGEKKTKTAEDVCSELLQESIKVKGEEITSSNYSKVFKKWAFAERKNVKYSEVQSAIGGYDRLFDDITGKGDSIKELKKNEKEIDRSLKDMIKTLDDKARDANSEKSGSGDKYSNASKVCSGYEKAITICTRSTIAAIKSQVANARQIVGKLVAYSPRKSTSEAAIYEEAAWLEGADDFASMEDIPAEEINADDVQEDPDVVVNIDVDGDECGANC